MTAPQLPADRPWLQRKTLRLYLRLWHHVDRMVDRAASRLSRWIFLHRSNMEYRFGPVDTQAELAAMMEHYRNSRVRPGESIVEYAQRQPPARRGR